MNTEKTKNHEKAELAIKRLKEVGDDLFESIKQEAKTYGEVDGQIRLVGKYFGLEKSKEREYLSAYMKERLKDEVNELLIKKQTSGSEKDTQEEVAWNIHLTHEKEKKTVTMKEKMVHVIDIMIEELEELHAKKNKEPEELAMIPKLVESITHVTAYAVIEKPERSVETIIKELEAYKASSSKSLESENNTQG